MPNPKRSRKRRSRKPDRRRKALELLAASPDGVTESLLLAHGVTVPEMIKLVRDGFASASTDRVLAGRQRLEVARIRITEAGRRALADL